ncbi:MAG: carboxypeptidase-like regulatory domain-containing protein [Candidatus Binatota bacterium]
MINSNRSRICFVAAVAALILFSLSVVEYVAAGDPVPGIDISLEEIPAGQVRKATTGNDGSFVFGKLPPGKYRVRMGSQRSATTEMTIGPKGGKITGKVES